jgi:serine/threonine protein kinase
MTDELVNAPVIPQRRAFPRPFGRYTLERNLTRGGMGEVHLAVPRGGHTRCVIKTIRGDLTGDKEFVGRFADEAKIMVRINHPNIIRVFDCGKVGTEYYIAMEYLHGKDLGDILDRAYERGEPMPKEQGLFLTKEILRGLDYAHNLTDETGRPMRLVHRDISPQNVLVGFDGSVKIIDFGLARTELLPARTMGALAVGKYGYMSPEQARHEKIDGRADLYSFGVMLFEVFTSDRLVDEQDQATLWHRVLNPRHRRPSTVIPDLPREIDDLIMRAVEVRPDDRFPDARAMLRHVEGFRTRAGAREDLVQYLRVLYPNADYEAPPVPNFAGEAEAAEQSVVIAMSEENAKSVFGRGQLPVEWTRQFKWAELKDGLEKKKASRQRDDRDADLRKWTDDQKHLAEPTLVAPTHSDGPAEDQTRVSRGAEGRANDVVPSGSLADLQKTAYEPKTRIRDADADPDVTVARPKLGEISVRPESFRDEEATVMMSAPPHLTWSGDTANHDAPDTRIAIASTPVVSTRDRDPGRTVDERWSDDRRDERRGDDRRDRDERRADDRRERDDRRSDPVRHREIREKNVPPSASATSASKRPSMGVVGRGPMDNEATAVAHEHTAEITDTQRAQPLVLIGVLLMGLAVVLLLVVLIFGA